MQAFDDFFFFRALKGWIRLRLVQGDLGLVDVVDNGVTNIEKIICGTQYDRNQAGEETQPLSLVEISDRTDIPSEPRFRRSEILSAMLHEMTHATFKIHGCKLQLRPLRSTHGHP